MDKSSVKPRAPFRQNRSNDQHVNYSSSKDPHFNGEEKKAYFSWTALLTHKGTNVFLPVAVLFLLLVCFGHPRFSAETNEGTSKDGERRNKVLNSGAFSRRDEASYENISRGPTISATKALKVSYPIFVASFSKSGTTSAYYAFECYLGPEYVAHRWTTSAAKGGAPELIGRCMEQNIHNQRPPFAGCGTNGNNNLTQTVVWTDTAYMGGESGCYHPNLDALDQIWDAYPHATLLLVRRNATEWFHSANSQRAFFIAKWAKSCPQMPNELDMDVWVEFYQNYTDRVREFARQRRGQMTYVEVELESPDTGRILQDQIGLPASCWKHCKSSFIKEKCKDLQ
ncbi:expressed unknown protein [Seminavis robusta]|uniref:Sulfotransferase n=1 Tax=Seminavis robusta TaxID=568900 RepID=A0A9N8DBV9_9STRA|nr:expressed unknown protein [Seminavis robusta]|eukprot:Sro73_g040450.1 n/a (340) ;mRNA; r:92190-93209